MRSLVSQLSIHKLEVFCTVIELNSFSRASQKLNITQPVVSAHIKGLTDKFETPLIVKNGRRIVLTEDGERVHRWARELINRTLEFEREMADSQRGVVGRASIGASMTIGSYLLPALVSEFRHAHPLGEISVQAYNPMAATDAIHSGVCDYSFTIMDPRHDVEGLDVKRIADDQLVLVTSERVPHLEGPLTPDVISGLPFVSAQAGMPRREIEESLLEHYGIRRRSIILEFGHAESLKQAVQAGAGYAFVFRSSLRDELTTGLLREVATPGMELKVPVYLVRRPNKRMSSFQQRLMEFLSEKISAQLEGRPSG
ncbi:DNA-binding transcriptional LysR family regulator [Neorhizobium galegae]|uniref:LysR family transcriptional regulator n=1 Tax=Neorhizobium galegae TaxID=399 RepID=UPI001AEB913C|nr:LysR family transcriptional regulator [Neorhizobium galegae]MBP2562515.1 DNA-binding transcriptional LysR family regulator [Neorhizobium galegae]